MNITYYPDKESVTIAMEQDEPLLVLVSFSGEQVIISQIDEGVEGNILIRKVGLPDTDIDKYFRIVLDHSGADWTFVCPPDYNGMTRKDKRIERFFKDGMTVIPEALKELGYDVPVEIPKRYRRHFDMMGD